jgi:hypothetical protein
LISKTHIIRIGAVMKKLLSIIIPVLLLSSCLSVDTRITLNEDGSGEVQLNYRISQIALNIGMYDKNSSDLPLPVSLKDFERTVEKIDGLELIPNSWSYKENEEYIEIAAAMYFTTIDELNQFYSPGSEAISITEADGGATYNQLIHSTPEVEADPDSIEFAETFFKDYALSFTVVLPGTIESSNIGEISSNTVSYSISIPELVGTNDEIRLEIKY